MSLSCWKLLLGVHMDLVNGVLHLLELLVTLPSHRLINLQLFAEAPSRNISGAETQELPINDPASHHLQLDG